MFDVPILKRGASTRDWFGPAHARRPERPTPMDQDRFDALTRLAGAGRSRRGLVKLAGAALFGAASLGRFGAAEARAKRAAGNSCGTNSDCASGLCVQESRTRKICHCRSAGDCPVGDVCNTPVCQPNGYCGVTVNVGVACDDGSLCTLNDVCQPDGSCQGAPVVCESDNNACTADVCDPATGLCVHPPIDCDDGNDCTVDTCDSVLGCQHAPAADGTLCDNGGGAGSGYCQSGACVELHPACVAQYPDYFVNCPPGQICYGGSTCSCHIGGCSSAGDCGGWGACFAGCCCAPDYSQSVGCAPGHNNDCCSGWCGSNGRCAPKPT